MRAWQKAALGAALAAALLITGGQALAHGKELEVKVQTVTVEVSKPETRLYIVSVAYEGDQEPATNAKVQLSATRVNGGPGVGPVILAPLNEAGLYGGQVTFPRFGDWTVTIEVADALGSGEASLTEEVLPAAPAAEATSGATSYAPQSVGLFLRFDARDVASIVVRVAHSLAAVAWYGLTVAILGAFYVVPASHRRALLQGVARLFPWIAGLSLAVLAASGLYNAIYNAPVRPPGIFNVAVMERIPFGMAYLASLAVKIIALTAGAGLALAMARALRKSIAPLPPQGASADASISLAVVAAAMTQTAAAVSLKRLALANAAFGVAAAVAVSVAIHLHLLSHLALVVPG